ncbi:TetR family transcriptional regulator [Rhodococcus opacus]|nr:TetR family transcriptional regulator [Rhodococcus opacus]
MTAKKVPPRDRLLAAADDLFFKEGIRAVGINRVLEEARTPIMTLYRNFGSKDGLAAAYLERRGERVREEVIGEVGRRASSPREAILMTFDIVLEGLEKGDFRGCPFINATVEMASPDHEVTKIAQRIKGAGRAYFAELAAEMGVPDPVGLAIQLTVLLDGATASAVLFRDSSGADNARAAAETLLDAAMAAVPAGETTASSELRC